MATSIEQKIVQLKFDNRDFEKNTKQTMSTLDKLKSKLSFKDSGKNLENGMVTAIETVNKKFSIMEIVGVTALVNIANSAVETGKTIIKALTVDQVWSGWEKMGKQITSVQTLVNSTGKSVEEIEKYLDELQWYSDETSYSFTEMADAMASMSVTGGDLDKLLPTITGIANATAFAGKGAAEFQRTIYNLTQSYQSGYLQARDWMSLQQAGTSSKQLIEALIASGEELGKIKKGQVTQQNFTGTLKDKWATTDVIESAFSKFSALSNRVYKEVLKGTDETASEIIERLISTENEFSNLSIRAFKSAQEAKTLSESLNATADAVSSAWMRMFKDIFGNYTQQKDIWTDLANFLYDGLVEPLNKIEYKIKYAFNFKLPLFDKLNKLSEFNNETTATLKTLEEYQKVVSRVWRGDYNNVGDNPDRFYLLRKEGYNASVVQNLVNYGYKHKITIDEVIKAENKHMTASEREIIEEKKKQIELEKTTKTYDGLLDRYRDYSREQLIALGLSEEDVDTFEILQEAAKKYGMTIDSLYEKMSEGNAHDLLFGRAKKDKDGNYLLDKETGERIYEVTGAFQYLGNILTSIFVAIKEAWKSVFPEKTWVTILFNVSKLRDFLAGISNALDDVEDGLDENGEKIYKHNKTVQNIVDTLRGLFSILKLIKTFVGGAFTIVWTVFKTVLETFGLTILDFTGMLGNMIATFTDFVTKNEFILKGIKKVTIAITNFIRNIYSSLYNWISMNGVFEKIKNTFITMYNAIKGFIQGFKGKELKDIPKYIAENFINVGKWIFEGLKNGISNNASKIIDVVKTVALSIIQVFKDIFQIHSPSKTMFDIASNIIFGLIDGIKSAAGTLFEIIKALDQKILELIKNFDIGSFITIALTSLTAIITLKTVKIVNDIVKIIGGFADAVSDVIRAAAGLMNAVKVKIYVSIIQDIVKSIVLIVGAIALLSALDKEKVQFAVGVIGVIFGGMVVLFGLLIALSVIINKTNTSIKDMGTMFAGIAGILLAISASLYLVSLAMKNIDKVENWYAPLIAFGVFIVIVVGVLAAMVLLSKYGSSKKVIVQSSGLILAIAALMLIMGHVIKKIGRLSTRDFEQGMLGLKRCFIMIEVLLLSMIPLTKFSNGKVIKSASLLLLSFGAMFLLFSMALKKMGKLSTRDFQQGIAGIGACLGMLIGLLVMLKTLDVKSKSGKSSFKNVSDILLKVAGAILILSLAVKILGSMKLGVMIQGIVGVTLLLAAIGGLIVGLNKLISKDSKNVGKAAAIILAIAAAITILSLSVKILGSMKIGDFLQGIIGIGVIMIMLKIVLDSASKLNPKALGVIISIIGTIILLITSVIILAHMDLARTVIAVGELTILMLALSLLLKAVSKLSETNSKNVLKTIGQMVLILGVLVGAVWLLSTFDATKALPNALACAVLLIAITSSLFIISKVNNIGNISSSLITMLAIIALIGGIAFVLASMSNTQNAVTNATALSIVLSAMTLVLLGLTAISKMKINFASLFKTLGALAILLASIVVIALVLNGIKDVSLNIPVVIAIGALLGYLTLLLIPLTLIGTDGPAGLIGAGILLAFVVALAAVIWAIGEFSNDSVLKALDMGGKVLVKLAEILTEIVGTVIKGIAKAIMSILPALGESLSDFAIALMPFITIMSSIPRSLLNGVTTLTLAILELTFASFINGINRLLSIITFGGDNPLWRLGKNLSDFALASKEFIEICQTIPENGANAIKTLSDAIMTITKAALLDRISSFLSFGGSNSLAKFASQLQTLGKGLANFTKEVKDLKSKDVETSEHAANIIKILADASNQLPKSGGLFSVFTGNRQDLKDFANNIPDVADGVSGFVSKLKGKIDSKSVSLAETASNILKNLADVAKDMPKNGGLFSAFTGNKQGLDDFAKTMPEVGKSVSEFIKNLKINGKDFSDQDIKNVDTVVRVMESFVNLFTATKSLLSETETTKIETSGYKDGFLQKLKKIFWGGDDTHSSYKEVSKSADIEGVKTFVTDISTMITNLAPYIKSFIETVSESFGDDEKAYEKVTVMVSVLEAITSFAESLQPSKFSSLQTIFTNTGVYDDLKSFIEWLPNLAESLKGFTEKCKNLTYDKTKTTDVLSFIDTIASIIEKISNIDYSTLILKIGFGYVISAINSILKNQVKSLLETIKTINNEDVNKTKVVMDNVFGTIVTLFERLSGINNVLVSATALASISKSLPTIGKSLSDFISDVASTKDEDITSAKTKISDIFDIIVKTFDTLSTDRIATMTSSLIKMIADSLKGVIENVDLFNNIVKAGDYLITTFTDSVNSNDNKNKLNNKITEMANNAVTYLKNALKINSPSKETEELGSYFVDGFILGIKKKLDASVKEVVDFGKKQNEALKSSLLNTGMLADSDMTIQPTIKPIVDLTNVNEASNSINSLLSNKLIPANLQVSSISSGINNINSNKNNNMLYNAIDKLGDKFSNTPTNTYNIGGITYDSDTAVGNAIDQLIRALDVDRRS